MKKKPKPRFTPSGRITKNANNIWTAEIDEKGEHWYGCVVIHRRSKQEVQKLRGLFLKAMNK